MKWIVGLTGALYAGALWIEYQTALLLGTGCFLFAAGSALIVLAAALYRAPEGHEQRDGLQVRPRKHRPNLVRHIKFSQPARARQ